ncbi:MAG: excinuclease ABC subunit UvrC [Clostridia bacterium]|nr:excinuclease ABC subunit UvrC [Clostridia bacterium]
MNEAISRTLKTLPDKSGVYIMYDADKNVLYVGKAKVLKNRVRQYFHTNQKPIKVQAMLNHVETLDYIVTQSETDAFALENTLIKKHKPPFNILLKDDKQYPYIKVDLKQPFPRFSFVRKISKDGHKYFGPITTGGSALWEILHKIFPFATCKHDFSKLKKNFRPCLNYHIGTCLAPCIHQDVKEQYRKQVEKALEFLKGDVSFVCQRLKQKMMEESEKTNYESALEYKRYLEVAEKYGQKHLVSLNKKVDFDCFAIVFDGQNTAVNHTMVRDGKVNFSDNVSVDDGGIETAQTLESFLIEYADKMQLSAEVYVNVNQSFEALEETLSKIVGKKVVVSYPLRGVKKQLVQMASDNATNFLDRQKSQIDKKYQATIGAVLQLKELLGLEILPKRIECFDVSNISGVHKVASMVVFENGEKATKKYRRFKIKTVEGANDFACMKETLLRRFAHLDQEFGAMPDLVVVDGGLGQLTYAKQAVLEAGIKVQLASLAEKEELVFLPCDNIPRRLPVNSPALNLLINLRDEAHRFAITYYRNLHTKSALKSVLENIAGMGQKRIVALQKKFKTIEALENASLEEIESTPSLNKPTAKAVYDFVHKEEK